MSKRRMAHICLALLLAATACAITAKYAFYVPRRP